MSALDMAVNAAAAVLAIADAELADPLQAHIGRLGERGFHVAELAGHMALVSIAEDLRIIRLVLERACPSPAMAGDGD